MKIFIRIELFGEHLIVSKTSNTFAASDDQIFVLFKFVVSYYLCMLYVK